MWTYAMMQVPMEPWNTAAGLGQRLVMLVMFVVWAVISIRLFLAYLRARDRARRYQMEQMAASAKDLQIAVSIDTSALQRDLRSAMAAMLNLGSAIGNARQKGARSGAAENPANLVP
jgi:hypothetical protein